LFNAQMIACIIDTYQRIGIDLFKERVYAANH
jgi:hypothetical protein